MIIETIYAGRNNVFSLQLVRGGEVLNLLTITGYEITLSNGKVISSEDEGAEAAFLEKDDGVVEINIGPLLTEDDQGKHTAYLSTFDPVNTEGVRWPDFKLKVK
jgi:hypothetical protein